MAKWAYFADIKTLQSVIRFETGKETTDCLALDARGQNKGMERASQLTNATNHYLISQLSYSCH